MEMKFLRGIEGKGKKRPKQKGIHWRKNHGYTNRDVKKTLAIEIAQAC